jgi:hypothetical protein
LDPSLGYTGAKVAGHTLWPYKLVVRIFEDAQATADEKDGMEVILHTKTPVTGFERVQDANQQHRHPIRDATAAAPGKAPEFLKKVDDPAQRRWKLQTPRGSISCNYIVHATNGYAAHLLPFLAGQGLAEDNSDVDVRHQTATDPEATTVSSPQFEELQHPLSQSADSSHPILFKPKPRGMYGIIPTRGQVAAVRASVHAGDLGWRNSWDGGGGGWEYWFPRYQGLVETTNRSDVHGTGTSTRNENGTAQTENTSYRNPLIIFGGGRQNAGENMESGETDDGILNERVGRALREFLPHWFPGKFEGGEDAWEMEWVSSIFFSSSNMIVADCAFYVLDWDNGVYEDRRSFCMYFRLPLLSVFVDRPYPLACLGRPSTTSLQGSR